ncbi:MAG: DUF4956 domain-containing protein [Planctomycetes bacterium]|nr:DUF4956 domain-containing protein [Planctomycetota bacterium]
MPDWLRRSFDATPIGPWQTLLIRLVAALLLGSVVVGIHRATRGRTSDHSTTFSATLVMLCVLIAMVTQVIGENVAWAFSLAGVLSIVRFRTVLRDTKDTAFVIFAVVVGMSIGAGQPAIALIGLATVGIAAAVYRDRPREAAVVLHQKLLIVKLSWSPELETQLRDALSKYVTDVQSLAASTIRQGSAMELHYRVNLPLTASLPQLIADLNRLEGILAIEIRSEHTAD